VTLNPKHDPSCRLCLSFGEPSGSVAYDQSLYGNHGTIVGAARIRAWPQFGIYCDGVDDYVSIPLRFVNLYSEWTLCVWLKWRYRYPESYRFALANGLWLNSGFVVLLDKIYDRMFWEIYDDALGRRNVALFTATGRWFFATVTFKTYTALRVYYDGALKGENADVSVIRPTTYDFVLGAQGDGSVFGAVDIGEVRVYDRVLSDSEIRTLYVYGKQRLRQPRAPAFRKRLWKRLWPTVRV